MATLIHRSLVEGGRASLWQGGADDVTDDRQRFDVLVLCAEEFQPEARLVARPGTLVVYAPNDDDPNHPLTKAQIDLAVRAAGAVVKSYREGKKVLVSCMQGRNRSGLVTALSLHLLYGLSGKKATALIRSKIPNALTNLDFTRFLSKVPARGIGVS